MSALLLARPDVCWRIERDLVADGSIKQVQTLPAPPPKNPLALKNAPHNPGSDDEACEEQRDADERSDGEPEDDAACNRNRTTWGDLSQTTYQRALRRCDNVAFSLLNQQAILKKGCLITNRQELQKLVTYCTDLRMGDTIDTHFRTRGKAIDEIVRIYASKGKRGSGLALPVKYNLRGAFSASVVGSA